MNMPVLMPAVKTYNVKKAIKEFDCTKREAISAHTIKSTSKHVATYTLVIIKKGNYIDKFKSLGNKADGYSGPQVGINHKILRITNFQFRVTFCPGHHFCSHSIHIFISNNGMVYVVQSISDDDMNNARD